MSSVYLIPCYLHEEGIHVLPNYLLDCIKKCSVLFVENERTARRFLKMLDKQIVIDDFEWITIHKVEEKVITIFEKHLINNKNIGIISEAGCPGIADPGQQLVAIAQQKQAKIYPLVGPSSILLALMASGMNGQSFQFNGYLPIDTHLRKKTIQQLEQEAKKKNSTQIFIETPYRNNQLLKDILSVCNNQTLLCIALNITAPSESIITKTVGEWKKNIPDLHKQLAIFLLQ